MPKLQPVLSGFADALKKPKRLPNLSCSFVMLANWTVADDVIDAPDVEIGGVETDNRQIYWGADGVCVNQLLPRTTTILIPVANLNQIFVKCSNSIESKRMYFTCFDEI